MLQRRARLPEPQAPGEVALSVTGARVRLGGVTILDDVSLAVHAGEIVALVGPNGAGKSTLLGVLTGDISAGGGSVTLAGQPLERWSATEAAMRRAVLVQRVTLSFPFTVQQVVEMGRAPWVRTPLEDDDSAVARAMAATDTADLADRIFNSLSDRKSTRLNSSHVAISYAVFCL